MKCVESKDFLTLHLKCDECFEIVAGQGPTQCAKISSLGRSTLSDKCAKKPKLDYAERGVRRLETS